MYYAGETFDSEIIPMGMEILARSKPGTLLFDTTIESIQTILTASYSKISKENLLILSKFLKTIFMQTPAVIPLISHPALLQVEYEHGLEKLPISSDNPLTEITILSPQRISLFRYINNDNSEHFYQSPHSFDSVYTTNSDSIFIEIKPFISQKMVQVTKLENGKSLRFKINRPHGCKYTEISSDGTIMQSNIYLVDNKFGRGFISDEIFYPFTMHDSLSNHLNNEE